MSCSGCGNMIHGAVGLAKVGAQLIGLPIDLADADAIKARAEVCRCCPNHARGRKLADQPCKGVAINSVCTACSCVLAAKIRLASEQCPMTPPKWAAVERASKDGSNRA